MPTPLEREAKNRLDDDEVSIETRITGCIRMANAMFKERNFTDCNSVLMVLQERYPFLKDKNITFSNQPDWRNVKATDQQMLITIINQMKTPDLTTSAPSLPRAHSSKPNFSKLNRSRLFEILGIGSNPSAIQVENPSMAQARWVEGNAPQNVGSSPKEARELREVAKLSFAEINKVYQEYLRKPGFNEAQNSPTYVDTTCNLVSNGYVFPITNTTNWIFAHPQGMPERDESEALGWKFHIGLDEEPSNLAKGMDIVREVLMKHQVSAFKFARPGFNLNNSEQVGKQITIYYEFDKNKDWKAILEEVEQRLSAEGIKASPAKAKSDKELGTSQYIGYRNDKGPDGKYADSTTNHNPAGRPDIFLDVLAIKPSAGPSRQEIAEQESLTDTSKKTRRPR